MGVRKGVSFGDAPLLKVFSGLIFTVVYKEAWVEEFAVWMEERM